VYGALFRFPAYPTFVRRTIPPIALVPLYTRYRLYSFAFIRTGRFPSPITRLTVCSIVTVVFRFDRFSRTFARAPRVLPSAEFRKRRERNKPVRFRVPPKSATGTSPAKFLATVRKSKIDFDEYNRIVPGRNYRRDAEYTKVYITTLLRHPPSNHGAVINTKPRRLGSYLVERNNIILRVTFFF